MDAQSLRATRLARRMTQAHLAVAASVSERTIIRAEQGIAVAAESWRSICAALDVDAEVRATTEDPFADPIIPDIDAWHAANGFGIWATVAVASALGCVVAFGLSVATLVETDSAAVSAMATTVSASALASLFYVALRALRYAKLSAALPNRMYGVAGGEVYVSSDEPATGISTVTRLGPCATVSEAKPYALWPLARVARVALANGRTFDLQGVNASVLAARLHPAHEAGLRTCA